MEKYFFSFFLFFSLTYSNSQVIKGQVVCGNLGVANANVTIDGGKIGTLTNSEGFFVLENVPVGNLYLIVSALNMVEKKIFIDVGIDDNYINIEVFPSNFNLDKVVLTGTRNPKNKLSSSVIVNILNSKKLENVQACNLAEGLNFQTGLRVENDCQTCNYTQLRMNGLSGGYSQILINGKAIFSPLTSLYGMEHIPVNMIERIEVVRGGGSSLYGSSAVGGVVNIFTKVPKVNRNSFGYNFNFINSKSIDKIFYANSTLLSQNNKRGITFFINNRQRDPYDHNNDNFSEISKIKGNFFGFNLFLLLSQKSKLELNLASLSEYRYGGEIVDLPPHLAMQAEEREHSVMLGNLDYQLYFNNEKSSLELYLAIQNTEREHYTGVRPELGSIDDADHLFNPPYGSSLNITNQVGFQLNHKITNSIGSNLLTFGSEYIIDDVFDEINAYNYLVDQNVYNFGTFAQSDLSLFEKINITSGIRFDKHSLVDDIILSPRLSFLYKFKSNTQFRFSFSTGFRAPQAFDTDMHISFAGGGVSRIVLSENLKEENSTSISSSINYDKLSITNSFGFTLQAFYTILDNVFYYEPDGMDEFGELYVKRNGDGAAVQGLTVEFRASILDKISFESGFTYQSSKYEKPVSYSQELPPLSNFIRTPKKYGYATLDYKLNEDFYFSTNLIHTGPMILVHMSGAPGQTDDEYFTTNDFNLFGVKASYLKRLNELSMSCEFSLGIKNLTNSYQNNFDSSKNRDSNFVYGPSTPRVFYFSIKFKSI